MFWNKEEKTDVIKFRLREDHVDAFPKPQQARKMLPQWLKSLPQVPEGANTRVAGTVKRCIPVLDACMSGYIIPAWCDIDIEVGEQKVLDEFNNETGKEPCVYFYSPSDFGLGEHFGTHSWQQVGNDCPLKNYPVGSVLMKLINPWVIETPPGWSCHFKSPANHYNNIRLIEGTVDTDTYKRTVNFPFFWDGCKQGKYSIKKGDPLVHVIPFKREELKAEFDTWDHETMTKIDQAHNTHFFDRYKRLWWHKRKQ